MSDKDLELKVSDRRDFFKTAGVGLAAGGGVIRSLDYGANTMIVNGIRYHVAIDVQVDLGGGHGAFTMLQEGWNVEFDYRIRSSVEREIVRLRRIPANFVIEEA